MTRLYVIVDPEHCAGRDPSLVGEQALRGGAAVLQLRAKRMSDAAQLSLARDLRARCARHGASFWVNDRIDIALLSEADGLHLGQDDLPVPEARKLAPGLALAVSTHSPEQVAAACAVGITMIGFGPIFATQSKERPSPTVGISGLGAICAAHPTLDVVAIGGIQVAHGRELAAAGARYAAVISAVCGAAEPEAAARALTYALAQR